MQAETESHRVNKATDNQLWTGVLGTDAGHVLASLRSGKPIYHTSPLDSRTYCLRSH